MPKKIEAPLTAAKVEEILGRPYSWIVKPDGPDTFSAKIAEFPGCVSQGATFDEAWANLREVAAEWLQASHASHFPIPDPPSDELPSGKLLLRMRRSIHSRAQQRAEADGVSLNAWIVSVVSEALGMTRTARTTAVVQTTMNYAEGSVGGNPPGCTIVVDTVARSFGRLTQLVGTYPTLPPHMTDEVR
jgi:antitoxin HicB